MTVRELIALLQAHDGDAIVVARGYESGYDDITGGEEIEVVDRQGPGGKQAWWDGRYNDPLSGDETDRIKVVSL